MQLAQLRKAERRGEKHHDELSETSDRCERIPAHFSDDSLFDTRSLLRATRFRAMSFALIHMRS